MSDFPITPEYADATGKWAEKIENRSLLFEKFSLPKNWVSERPFKTNEAHRWSILRVCENGEAAFRNDLDLAHRRARRENNSKITEQAKQTVEILEKFQHSAAAGKTLAEERKRHSRRLLELLRQSHGERCHVVAGKLESRLALNLADGLVENGGASLDRLFGMPFIPGSAVKGVARHAALARIEGLPERSPERARELDQYRRIFGTTTGEWDKKGSLQAYRSETTEPCDQKGAVVFLPAYPLSDAPLEVDLTNVHTPDYYTGNRKDNLRPGNPKALRNENPRPNPFPTVAAGSVFGFALILNRHGFDAPELLQKAATLLEEALTVSGIGAKTGAGYGWFSIVSSEQYLTSETGKKSEERHPAKEVGPAAATAAPPAPKDPGPEKAPIDDETFAHKMLQLPELPEEEQRELLSVLKKERAQKLKKWIKSKKDTDRKRVEAIRSAAANLDIPLP